MIPITRLGLAARKFHPTWILFAVVVMIVVAGMVWIPAVVVMKAERYQPAEERPAPGKTAVPAEEVPGTSEPRKPTRTGPKTIWVDLSKNIGIV